ncbi:hypothetical protein ABZ820_20230 [Streptomyces diacarni]|uniref:hypothetical protein n=1 Tax=Streptomyces diacarni TaxID=2800381 RepID=UPI0033E63C1A
MRAGPLRLRLAYERASFRGAGPLPGDGPRGGLARDGYWRGASCPDGNAPVFFTVVRQASRSDELDHPSHAETAYQTSALEAFSKRSAASHDCTLKETKD